MRLTIRHNLVMVVAAVVLFVVLVIVVVVQLVPRSCSLLPFQAYFSLVPIQASTEPQDRPNHRGSVEQGLDTSTEHQCRTRTDIRRTVTRASES